jgi:hypothetical protein
MRILHGQQVRMAFSGAYSAQRRENLIKSFNFSGWNSARLSDMRRHVGCVYPRKLNAFFSDDNPKVRIKPYFLQRKPLIKA